MYVCMYVCVYTYIYIYIYTHTHTAYLVLPLPPYAASPVLALLSAPPCNLGPSVPHPILPKESKSVHCTPNLPTKIIPAKFTVRFLSLVPSSLARPI